MLIPSEEQIQDVQTVPINIISSSSTTNNTTNNNAYPVPEQAAAATEQIFLPSGDIIHPLQDHPSCLLQPQGAVLINIRNDFQYYEPNEHFVQFQPQLLLQPSTQGPQQGHYSEADIDMLNYSNES